jgi:ABC-type dipeptide/oligopeptide/nickel transport system ATPase subunit
MQIRKAQRKNARIKLGIQGPSGSGKTIGALKLAYGLTNNWDKVVVIDTENSSAELYAHLGSYSVLPLQSPYSPENYIKAIQLCVQEGYEVVVVDSISHEWEGAGGILEIHSNMTGNSFTNWSKLTPRHNAFINTILQSDVHVIATVRAKQDYVLSDKNGKMVPEKVGLKGITREGLDYEFTIVFELDIKHNCTATKDRTQLFANRPEFKLSHEIGEQLLKWSKEGISIDEVRTKVSEAPSVDVLRSLYHNYPEYQRELNQEFLDKRKLLESVNQNTNGNHTSTTQGK